MMKGCMLLIVFKFLIGMLAWAIITTIIIILMLIKQWLLSKLKSKCRCIRCLTPTPEDTPAVATPHIPQTVGAELMLHTPPSLATTPSTTTSTPSTVRSNKPLVTPEGAIASRTRSKKMKKKLNL